MGCYINPPWQGKREWLRENGTSFGSKLPEITDTTLPVCLVDNGVFFAAAVAYSASELRAFARDDSRPREWFSVEISKLESVSDVATYLY